MPRRPQLATRRLNASRRATGPTTQVRHIVATRANYRCEGCGLRLHDGNTWTEPHSFHHRRPRGAGGSRDTATNTPPNLLLLCGTGTTGCHGDIERRREAAYTAGMLVHQGTDPEQQPVRIWWRRLVHLTADGQYQETP
ncbi:HNH endonuclease [Nocardioides sp.]|uniref:HNH endonuclease n=1 Tax=Nocardioides sp. TaxID=35761 RepID=UPI003562A81D